MISIGTLYAPKKSHASGPASSIIEKYCAQHANGTLGSEGTFVLAGLACVGIFGPPTYNNIIKPGAIIAWDALKSLYYCCQDRKKDPVQLLIEKETRLSDDVRNILLAVTGSLNAAVKKSQREHEENGPTRNLFHRTTDQGGDCNVWHFPNLQVVLASRLTHEEAYDRFHPQTHPITPEVKTKFWNLMESPLKDNMSTRDYTRFQKKLRDCYQNGWIQAKDMDDLNPHISDSIVIDFGTIIEKQKNPSLLDDEQFNTEHREGTALNLSIEDYLANCPYEFLSCFRLIMTYHTLPGDILGQDTFNVDRDDFFLNERPIINPRNSRNVQDSSQGLSQDFSQNQTDIAIPIVQSHSSGNILPEDHEVSGDYTPPQSLRKSSDKLDEDDLV